VRRTLGWLELAWLIGCVWFWLAVGLSWGESREGVAWALLILGIPMAGVWFVGAILTGSVYAIVWGVRRRS